MSTTLPARPGRSARLPLTPGRAVVLLLGVPVVLALIVAGAFSFVQNVGRASFQVPTFTVPATPGTVVRLNLNGGNATLRSDSAATPGRATVTDTVDYALSRPTFRHDAAGGISLNCPWIDTGNCDLNATVDLPAADTPLDVQSGGGDVSATGLDGKATYSTDGGNLSLSNIAGLLTVSSGGGEVTANQLGGTPALTTDGGNVSATAVDAANVTVTSGGGDVTLSFAKAPRNVQVTSDGGNVTIIVPPGGGYIVNTMSDGGNVSGLRSARGATNEITVTSGGGNISVVQSA